MCSAYSGIPQWAITAVSCGCRRSTACIGYGPVWRPGIGPLPQCTTTGVAASASSPHTRSSRRSAGVEFADLNVHLEDPGAGLERRADILVDGRFGVERP